MVEVTVRKASERALLDGAVSFGSVAGALAWGGQFGPRQPRTARWYARLRKPSYTPPGPVFGGAWTILGVLIGYAGYRLRAAPPSRPRRLALACWWLTVAGMAGYSYEFFGRKKLGESTAVVAAMAASAGGLVGAATQVDRRAAAAASPLIGWLAFAGLLSEEIWRRNAP